jgi:hypothetical protein
MVWMVPSASDAEQQSQALSTVESRQVFTELSRDCTAPGDFLSAKRMNNAMKEFNSLDFDVTAKEGCRVMFSAGGPTDDHQREIDPERQPRTSDTSNPGELFSHGLIRFATNEDQPHDHLRTLPK